MFSDWKAVERCALVPLSHFILEIGAFFSFPLSFLHPHSHDNDECRVAHTQTHAHAHARMRARACSPFFFGALIIVFYFLLSSSI